LKGRLKLDELEKLHFNLSGMQVVDETRKKLGKVVDYTIDMGSFYIQQLTVRRPLMHSFNDTELIIHRTQIIEINNDAIVVHSQAKEPEPERAEVIGSYVNPFRKQADISETTAQGPS
jgi:sporulation protein YlmC with PRC-barrel domain